MPTGNPYSYDQMFDNVVEGTGKGVELSVNWQVNSWLSLIGTYTWQELDLSETPDYQGQQSTPNISSINHPSHQASLRSAIDLAEDWQLNGWLRYVDEVLARSSEDFYARRMIPVPSYFLFDANLVWKPRKNLEIMPDGRNLLNSSQLEYIAELITPATEIERSVYCKVTWNL